MATWLGTIIDVVQAGAQVYTAAQGGGSVGRGGAVAPTPQTVSPAGMFDTPSIGTIPAAAGPVIMGGMRAIGSMGPRIMTALGALTRSAAGRRLLALTKTVGIQAAAAALGLTIADALGLLGEQVGKRRRGRGISSRDLRTTRRTTRRLIRASQDLSALASCVKVRRRSPCG